MTPEEVALRALQLSEQSAEWRGYATNQRLTDVRRKVPLADAPLTDDGSIARERMAAEILAAALRLVRDMVGDELIQAACDLAAEPDTTSSRKAELLALARRMELAALPFDQFEGAYGLRAVADEARAVANGAPPDLFSTIPGRISKYRIDICRLEALSWDAYLAGWPELSGAERQAAISVAYGTVWETIRKWRPMLEQRWGKSAVASRLSAERMAAQRSWRRWAMKPGEEWQVALRRSGSRYKEVERRHSTLAERERKA